MLELVSTMSEGAFSSLPATMMRGVVKTVTVRVLVENVVAG